MFSNFFKAFVRRVGYFLPFGCTRFTQQNLKGQGSILDIGYGQGTPMSRVNKRKKIFSVGCDIYLPCLTKCKQRRTHDALVLCDARMLPFKSKSFNVVLCTQVLEHLDKQEGQNLLRAMERIARKKVVITTPTGSLERMAQNGNPYQRHKTGWFPDELKGEGYKVRGYGGFKLLNRLFYRIPGARFWFDYIDDFLLGLVPLVYFFPRLAWGMMCVKNIEMDSS